MLLKTDFSHQARRYYPYLLLAGVLVGLYFSSFYSYVFFHSIAELVSIVIAFGIFVVAWNARRFINNSYFIFIGIAYLFIGSIDMVHTLSYKGMEVFEGHGSNLPTQLWIAARYTESLSLVAATLFLGRKLKPGLVSAGYFIAIALLLTAVFYWHIFPVCYIEGTGLTPFKKISEYVIAGIFLIAFLLLWRRRREFDKSVFRLIATSIFVIMGAEILFTSYGGVYDLANLGGHLLKVIAFFLIYKALIETGIAKPYALLLRDLKQNEEQLRRRAEEMETLMDVIPTAVWVSDDPLCRHIIGNRMANDFYEANEGDNVSAGPEPGAPIPPRRFFHKGRELAPEELPMQQASRENREIRDSELEVLTASGKRLNMLGSAIPIRDEQGKVRGCVASFIDITGRKQAESALDKSRRKFQLLAETAALLIQSASPEQIIEQICHKVMGHLDCQYFFNFLTAEKQERLHLNAYAGISPEAAADVEWLDYGVAVSGCVALQGQRMVAEHIQESDDELTRLVKSFGIQAYACYPLVCESQVIGTLSFGSTSKTSFTDEETEMMQTVADQVAVAVARKRAEDNIQRSRARLGLATAAAELGVFEWDALSDAAVWENEQMFRIFGRSHEDGALTRTQIEQVIHPDDLAATVQALQSAMQTGRLFHSICRIRREDGAWRWVEFNGLYEMDREKRLVKLVSTISDITMRKETEKALQSSEARYRMLVESSPDIVALLDYDGNIVDCNQALPGLLGMEKEAVTGKNVSHFARGVTREQLEEYGTLVRQKGLGEGEFMVTTSGGQMVRLWVKIAVITGDDGAPFQSIMYARDYSERKKLEELKDEFIGLVSHELRTPLTVIMGSLNTVLSELPNLSPGELEQLLRDAALETDNMSHLVGNLLELARSQANELSLHREPVKVKEAFRGAIRKIKRQFPNRSFVTRSPVPAVAVPADPLRLERILYNLLENAAKYSPPKTKVIITATMFPDHLLVGVSDHGPGIPEYYQHKIFEPFERLGQDHSQGAGLGLLVCRRLVEAHGGHIWVESKPGQGATFYFTLPLTPGAGQGLPG